jgi:hypothetical protein
VFAFLPQQTKSDLKKASIPTTLKLLQKIETNAKLFRIKINTVSLSSNDAITVRGIDTLEPLLGFFNKLQQIGDISIISLVPYKSKIDFKVTIKTSLPSTKEIAFQDLYTPFRAKTKKALKLNAIVDDMIQIRGEWYKKGDTVDGYTVSKITPLKVKLKKANKTKTLSLVE